MGAGGGAYTARGRGEEKPSADKDADFLSAAGALRSVGATGASATGPLAT